MAAKQKILEEIHPLALIREVQLRPALYSRNNPEVASNHHKLKIWAEVAENLFPDWDLCSARSKDEKVVGLMKKWRNLRDTFKRQLEIQKRIREGANIKKKQYVYFRHMSFLTPHMSEEDAEGRYSPAPSLAAPAAHEPSWRAGLGGKGPRAEEPASTNDFGDIDEDKHFLMSLIPSFRRMNEDEKLTAKMEILKVIKMVKDNSASASAMELSYELMPERVLVGQDVKLEALSQAEGPHSHAETRDD
ncbi:uncharacterized protein LOC106135312 [Amyelois transitella]|uniref:uncharacterized protein LOC106135312 n=1 Tax=Amyelois transitella TaxID=680683 RepID=UPI00067CC2F8|nr:uncharacterized protein LOC106135312 [Amyelois transitella]